MPPFGRSASVSGWCGCKVVHCVFPASVSEYVSGSALRNPSFGVGIGCFSFGAIVVGNSGPPKS